MSRREKILVGLMVAAVCLGTLMLIGDRQKRAATIATPGQANTLTKMLTDLSAQIGSDSKREEHRYVLSTARVPWRETLFLSGADGASSPEVTGAAADDLPTNVSLVYSGYIETPQRRVAIINGIEYVVGDRLDKSAYTVQDIAPTQVVLAAPQQRMVSIPLVEGWELQTP
ncbi:MAG: hypothetical protein PVJ53_03490 [Desulfobacterales bacterium]|jgi:hypothetical protein